MLQHTQAGSQGGFDLLAGGGEEGVGLGATEAVEAIVGGPIVVLAVLGGEQAREGVATQGDQLGQDIILAGIDGQINLLPADPILNAGYSAFEKHKHLAASPLAQVMDLDSYLDPTWVKANARAFISKAKVVKNVPNVAAAPGAEVSRAANADKIRQLFERINLEPSDVTITVPWRNRSNDRNG